MKIEELRDYERSRNCRRHKDSIRQYQRVKIFDHEAHKKLVAWLIEWAQSKEFVLDMVNSAHEWLVEQRYELPPFKTLVRIAEHAKATSQDNDFEQVSVAIDRKMKAMINHWFESASCREKRYWHRLKQDREHKISGATTKFYALLLINAHLYCLLLM